MNYKGGWLWNLTQENNCLNRVFQFFLIAHVFCLWIKIDNTGIKQPDNQLRRISLLHPGSLIHKLLPQYTLPNLYSPMVTRFYTLHIT